jgi:hypothetical protein
MQRNDAVARRLVVALMRLAGGDCLHNDPAGFYMTLPPRCVVCGYKKPSA